jgi:ribosomal protein S18 acetylase RimI-like enzyme
MVASYMVSSEKMPDIARAVEDNEAEFLLALGRAGGGEERRDDQVHWIIGGSPIAYHNCVVRATLSPEEADEAVAASRELMTAKGVPGSWHVGPSMRPTDLGDRLRAQGFEGGPEPGMAADLDAMADVEQITGLRVDQVADETGLDAYESVLAAGFGEGPREASWVRAMYGRIGPGEDMPWRHFIGWLDGEPVTTASLFFAAEVAGLYFACTLPDLRGRGIGTAMTHATLVAARDLGFSTAVLGSSPMGYGLYERLGFREVCSIDVYEWGESVA